MYAIRRFNSDFRCYEFVTTNGVNFTIHLDKVQAYKSFDDALFALRQWFSDCTISSVPKTYKDFLVA